MIKRIRHIIFLRDILFLAVTTFGGPQAHLAMYIKILVKKRAYLTEEELMELYALCQILPGPTSTQTITALGFKIGGPNLAYLTLLVWVFPAFTIMTALGLLVSHFDATQQTLDFAKFIQPMAVGYVAYAAYLITTKVVKTYEGVSLMIISAIFSFMLRSPFVFPIIIILSGFVTAFKYKKLPIQHKSGIRINWSNFILWASVFIGIAVLGHFTRERPVLMFENFYRNGSLIFGGGQVLIPLMYTEFVEFKEYLSSAEFLTGYASVQSVPGPVFSFCSYIGALIMRDYGIGGEILGSVLATAGIFLPGTFLIFFTIRFWEQLKKYRVVKASLEGVNAASAGMVVAATFVLFLPIEPNFVNTMVIVATFSLLMFTKVPPPFIILAGLLAGFIL